MKLSHLIMGAATFAGLSQASLADPQTAGPSDVPQTGALLDSKEPPVATPAGKDAAAADHDSKAPEPPAGPAAESSAPESGAEGEKTDTKAMAESKQGPTVQVENLQTANGPIDPKTVKILAPFPAKPLGPIPSGWRLDASNSAPTFTRKVELAGEASVVLKIRPQVLVPDADGDAFFSIQEPGYDPAFGYQQSQTVSHILTKSIRQLDDDSKALGNAIERLEQLLGSLPRPPVPPTVPLSNTKLTDKR